MFRRAWWRAIPSELLIPVVVAAALDIASLLVPTDAGGLALVERTGLARDVVVLSGLLELRRRVPAGTARLLVAGAWLLGADAALSVGLSFAPMVLGRQIELGAFNAVSYVWAALAVLLAIAMITAARAWRSWTAPAAIVMSFAWRLPTDFAEAAFWRLGFAPIRAYLVLAPMLAQLALLAIYRRLGAMTSVPVADVGRAERGARRVATSLRAHAVLVVATVAGGVLLALSDVREMSDMTWQLYLAVLVAFATLATVVGEASGLLAMSGARVAKLNAGQLRVAAFGVLWCAPVQMGASFLVLGRVNAVVLGVPLVYLVAVIVGANAMSTLATKCGDRPLYRAITVRVTWVVAAQLLCSLELWMAQDPGVVPVGWWALGYLVLQLTSMLLLASAYARVAQRIQLAGAADVF